VCYWFSARSRQAFWLADLANNRPFPGFPTQWSYAAFVPAHSNGWLAMDLHHLSYYRHEVTHLLTASTSELGARSALIDQILGRCQLKKTGFRFYQIHQGFAC